MGRSLYFDDELRDVQHTLFSAFSAAQAGHWDDAQAEFEEAKEMLDQLVNLMAAVQLGEADPDRVEGLSTPGRWYGWCEVSDVTGTSGGDDGR